MKVKKRTAKLSGKKTHPVLTEKPTFDRANIMFVWNCNSFIIVLNNNSHPQPEKGRFTLDKNLAAHNIEISRFRCTLKISILFDREFCTKINFNANSLLWRSWWSYNTQISSIYNGIILIWCVFLPADLFELQVKKRMFWKSQILWVI